MIHKATTTRDYAQYVPGSSFPPQHLLSAQCAEYQETDGIYIPAYSLQPQLCQPGTRSGANGCLSCVVDVVALQIQGTQRPVKWQHFGQCRRAAWANFVGFVGMSMKIEFYQRGVDFESIRERNRARIADIVVLQLELS